MKNHFQKHPSTRETLSLEGHKRQVRRTLPDPSHAGVEAQAPKAMSFRIASADLGSAWYIYGAAVGELIKKGIPGASCDILPTAATIANVKMIEKGDAELGFSFSNVDRWAREGIISFSQRHQN